MKPLRSGRRSLQVLWWVATGAVPFASWSAVAWLDAKTRGIDHPPLLDAQFIAETAPTPPQTPVGWQHRRLPHDWAGSDPQVVEGWYRLAFQVDATDAAPWAVYLPTLSMNAAVYVNHHPIGDGGRFDDPIARRWNHPLIFPFPSSLITLGENVIHVRIAADRSGGGLLGPAYVGPEVRLRPAYRQRHLFKVVSLQGIAVSQAVVILFTATLWLLRRQETYYGWFALACLCWGLTWPNLLVVDIPVPTLAWYWFWYTAGVWFILLIVWFAMEFIGDRQLGVKRLLFTFGLAGSAATAGLAFFDASWFHTAATRGWTALAYLAIGFYAHSAQAALRRDPNNVDHQVAHFSALSLFGCGLHDGLVLTGVLGREQGFYAPYVAPVFQFGIGWILVRRFAGALGRSEALAAELNRRVEQMRHELERSNDRAGYADRERTLSDERERIMREIHDGLASHLVSTLAMLEHGDVRHDTVEEAVRGALEDLRMMVNSLDATGGDLLLALGMLRSTMRSRIEAGGIGMQWRVEEIPSLPDLGPQKVLQVVRIAQEAITNVLKHARATTVTLRAAMQSSEQGPRIDIEIADDGRGIGGAAEGGRGLDNMRRRAREIGAGLDVRSSSSGTVVRLSIPLVHPRFAG